jgi:hypothetical protein
MIYGVVAPALLQTLTVVFWRGHVLFLDYLSDLDGEVDVQCFLCSHLLCLEPMFTPVLVFLRSGRPTVPDKQQGYVSGFLKGRGCGEARPLPHTCAHIQTSTSQCSCKCIGTSVHLFLQGGWCCKKHIRTDIHSLRWCSQVAHCGNIHPGSTSTFIS